MNNSTGPRLRQVDSLRAIAVLGVVVAHAYYYRPVSGDSPVDRAVVVGTQAAPFILFVLSGCLLYAPFARRDLARGSPVSLRRFATNRALRILPLYYIVLAVVLIVEQDGGSARQWAIYGSFSQNFVYFPNQQLDRSMWYLVIEFQFYLLLPLLALCVARVARGSRRRAAFCLTGLGVASFAAHHYAWLVDPTPDPGWRFSILTHFFFIAAGMLLAIVQVSWQERFPRWLRGPLGSTGLWALAAAGCLVVLVARRYPLPSTGAVICIALVGVLLVGVCVLPLRPGLFTRVLEWRPLALVGIASYSLYLWHDPILEALSATLPAESGVAGLLGVGLPLCCLIALVSYGLVERPFLRLRGGWAVPAAAPHGRTGPGRMPANRLPHSAVLTTACLAGLLALALTLTVHPRSTGGPAEPPSDSSFNGVVVRKAGGERRRWKPPDRVDGFRW